MECGELSPLCVLRKQNEKRRALAALHTLRVKTRLEAELCPKVAFVRWISSSNSFSALAFSNHMVAPKTGEAENIGIECRRL